MKNRAHHRGKWLSAGLLIIVILAAYAGWAWQRPLPTLRPVITHLTAQTSAAVLTWPASGQAAVGVMGSDILETHGVQAPAPTASTAKIITALLVAQAKPLTSGQQGPPITLTASDVALYNAYNGQGGSVVPVTAGEQISEYQALQAMLLPSANNMADSLAVWAYGSLGAYQTAATAYLAQHGLKGTTVGSDASGLSPSTVSTARDLVALGELAMQNPVLAGIVGQPSASGIPVAGSVKNVNFLLGNSGIIGVKTGNSDQAGGVFVSASRTIVNNKPITIVTALVGAPDLWRSMSDSLPLIKSAQTNFKPVTIVKAGTVVGRYAQPWGGTITAAASQDLSVNTWQGSTLQANAHLSSIASNAKVGQTVGTIASGASSVKVQLQTASTRPTIWWRLSHPLR